MHVCIEKLSAEYNAATAIFSCDYRPNNITLSISKIGLQVETRISPCEILRL